MSKNMDAFFENQTLKNEFSMRGLDLSQVWQATPDDIELENRQLQHLLEWVDKYKQCPDRHKLEAEGYLFPPVYPGIDPDSDWLCFERWIEGKSVREKMIDQVLSEGEAKTGGLFSRKPETMTDEEIETELERLYTHIERTHFSIDLNEDLPPRLIYIILQGVLGEEFEFISGGCWHIDGCSGYCPDCVQRPWCEFGGNSCWSEDEEAGEIVFPEIVKRYVSPSPISLEILRNRQQEEDSGTDTDPF